MTFVINNVGALGQAATTWQSEQTSPGSTPAGTQINVQLVDGSEVTFTFDPDATA